MVVDRCGNAFAEEVELEGHVLRKGNSDVRSEYSSAGVMESAG
jgi:hypothetical protein